MRRILPAAAPHEFTPCDKMGKQVLEAAATFSVTVPTELVAELHSERCVRRVRQRDLADRIGVSVTALGRWERRTCEPRLDSLCAWAEELGFNVALVRSSSAAQASS